VTNLFGNRVVATALHTEMQQSYLEYAMSVIVGRALPDVRDGLKPVHRRILYAMHELGLTPDRPFRKCARVVGDVLGKYHPHGDQAVYDALVRLVQDFSSRYPLLAGHGNFGSVDDDPPAAMRYTETRLASVSHDGLLGEINLNTVDFAPNFDNSQQEPTLLPAQLPFLLLNGCTGIAVGMATNVPPHNLAEVVDGLIALIDRPQLTDEDLLSLIPGPDFPTGGEILEPDGIRDAYLTGRGSIAVRGIVSVEESQPGRGRHRRPMLVVSELPFQVNKAAWVEKVANLVNQGKIEGVADIRDESDRQGMRVVIELRREADPHHTLAQLYKQTNLQITFGAILLALVEGQPRQLTLRQLLQQFLDFRETTLIRRYTHELHQAQDRSEILQGMLLALNHLDDVIELLRQSPDGSAAKIGLRERFMLSDRQCDAILGMPLRRLTSLERQNLETEFAELTDRMQELNNLLENRHDRLKTLKKDLRSLKRRFGDQRRTRIQHPPNLPTQAPTPQLTPPRSIPKATPKTVLSPPIVNELPFQPPIIENVRVEITHGGLIWRRSLGSIPIKPGDRFHDLICQTFTTTTDQTLITITASGKAYPVAIQQIPNLNQCSVKPGSSLISLLPRLAQDEEIVTQFLASCPSNVPEVPPPPSDELLLLTNQGRLKRLNRDELGTSLLPTSRGISLFKLDMHEELRTVLFLPAHQSSNGQFIIATSGGRALKLALSSPQLPVLGRSSQGTKVMKLGKEEKIVGGLLAVDHDEYLVLITADGYGKKMRIEEIRLGNRGDLGTQVCQFLHKTDQLVGLLRLPNKENTDRLWLQTLKHGFISISPEQIPLESKDGQGQLIINLENHDVIHHCYLAPS